MLLKLADAMEAAKDELALLETLDVGKPIRFAQMMKGAIATFRYYAEAVDKVYGEIGPTGDQDLSLILREPLGSGGDCALELPATDGRMEGRACAGDGQCRD